MKILNQMHFILIVLMSFSVANAQNNDEDFVSEVQFLKELKSYGESNFGLILPSSFYSKWANSEEPNLYLYVSSKDSLKLVKGRKYFSYGFDKKSAIKTMDKYDNLGYATLLYETYGTSGARLSKHFLSYSNESISFIGFHEATHIHRRKSGNIPYVYEEALCDLMGSYGSLKLAKTRGEKDYQKMLKFTKKIESISSRINNCIAILESGDTTNLSINKRLLNDVLDKLGKNDQFMIERYKYEINNAYFIRNLSYTKYYYKLKILMNNYDEMKNFLAFVMTLSSKEEEATIMVDKEIERLSKE